MKINERGYWENNSTEGHGVDPGLMNGLAYFFNREGDRCDLDIIDVGCGDGSYTLFLRNQGFSCIGFDGNPYTEQITGGFCSVFDFSKPVGDNFFPVDWVLCLEVGEHIPKEYEQIFFDNLAKLGTIGVILSWATPGQGGDGHVNCKTNTEVSMEMLKRGFIRKLDKEDYLRNSCAEYPQPCYWFRNTLMVFERYDA